MGIPVLIMGESGSGKTYSMKNMDNKKTAVFSVEKNRLPFKNKLTLFKNSTYEIIGKEFKENKYKSYVIDDSQYLLVNEFFDRAKETGYQKFTDIALRFRNLVHYINRTLPDDVIVYFLHHTEQDSNTGKVKAKTIGKMLDDKLTVEGCFDIVLMTNTDGETFSFLTKTDGYNTVKSPEDMFEGDRIPNDLALVDKAIREYYNI